MNAEQRKKVQAAQLEISRQALIIEGVRDENQDSYDNMPEGLQSGEKGEAMQEAIDSLSQAVDSLAEVDDALSNLA